MGSLGPARSALLLHLRKESDIQLRVLTNRWPFWKAVITSTRGYSGIRAQSQGGSLGAR